MKSLALLMFLSFSVTLAYAQGKPSPPKNQKTTDVSMQPEKDTLQHEFKIYNRAMLFGDYLVAKDALFGLIVKYPERIDYIDSLARIYYALGAYPQGLLAAKIVLEKKPENLDMLELSAISQDALGNKKEALEAYEKLSQKTKNLNHAYQVAVLQFSLQRYGECAATTDKILSDPEAAKQKISINVDQTNTQEVSLVAAVRNLRGVMYKEMTQPDKAKTEFESALKETPDFMLAKNNLELLNKPADKPGDAGKGDKKKK